MQSSKTLISFPSSGHFCDELGQSNPPAGCYAAGVSNTVRNPNSGSPDTGSPLSSPIDPMIPASPPLCGSEEGEDYAGFTNDVKLPEDVEKSSSSVITDSPATLSSPFGASSSNFSCSQRRSYFSESDFDEPAPAPRYSCSFLPRSPPPVGAGLANMGNTCFLNAVFQCFTHTVPFVRKLFGVPGFPSHHGIGEFCTLTAVQQQIHVALSSPGKTLFPRAIVDNLSKFSSFFEINQQEDAHEFLQCLLDKLDSCLSKCVLKAENKPSSSNTIVTEVFGGRLMSQLRCCTCGHSSKTYEPLIDLSLEIDDVDDLEGALKSFTKAEKLEDDEVRITCQRCKEKVAVEKQLMINQTPSVIALHLKRFKTDGFIVEKIDRAVEYPVELDLTPYTTGDQKSEHVDELMYELYAFVEHVGWSSTSGHYISYVRSTPGRWYRFDDSEVKRVSIGFALSRKAYILFYAKKGTPWPCTLVEAIQSCYTSTSPTSVLDFNESFRTSSDDIRALPSPIHVAQNKVLKVAKGSPVLSDGHGFGVCNTYKVTTAVEDTEEKTPYASSAGPSPANIRDGNEKSDQDTSNCADGGKSQGESGKDEMVRTVVKNEGDRAIDDFMYNSDGDTEICASITLKRDEIFNRSKEADQTTALGIPSSISQSPDLYSQMLPEVEQHPIPYHPKTTSRSTLVKKRDSGVMDRERKLALRSMQRFPSCRRSIFQAALLSQRGSLKKKKKTVAKGFCFL